MTVTLEYHIMKFIFKFRNKLSNNGKKWIPLVIYLHLRAASFSWLSTYSDQIDSLLIIIFLDQTNLIVEDTHRERWEFIRRFS